LRFSVETEDRVQEKILVVEDDRVALKSVSQFLTGEGYDVERASNGSEALKLLEEEKFDLVLSDVIMPGIDGQQILSCVRSRFASTRIILMSGNFTLAPSTIFYQRANGYVLKPIDLEKLLEKIKDALKTD
jgi:CheY-like chemotaxis protein